MTSGVLGTVVGYCGGTTPSPTYESIGDWTEALRVTFDPQRLTLEEVLRMFWSEHQPMPLAFTGTQYQNCEAHHSNTSVSKHK